jgi:hypothetical protein
MAKSWMKNRNLPLPLPSMAKWQIFFAICHCHAISSMADEEQDLRKMAKKDEEQKFLPLPCTSF